jgi:transposase
MKNVCHASFSTIRKFLRDVVGETVSRGYLVKLIGKVSRSLERPYEELLERIPLEANLNVDETGHKDNGDRFWTWVFKAELYVLFRIDKSRGSQVLIEVLGREFEGTLGCDYFSAYRKFMKDFQVAVQFCIAHLIRDVKFLTTLPDLPTRAYGDKLLAALKALFHVIHQHDALPAEAFAAALAQAKADIIRIGRDEAPSLIDVNGKERRREAQNMAERFRKHAEAYFTFITTPGMDPTNNVAEQAIRFVVIDRHVTQGTRSATGRRANERLWTVIATCALQGRSAFAFILQAVEAYFHGRDLLVDEVVLHDQQPRALHRAQGFEIELVLAPSGAGDPRRCVPQGIHHAVIQEGRIDRLGQDAVQVRRIGMSRSPSEMCAETRMTRGGSSRPSPVLMVFAAAMPSKPGIM